MKKIYSIIALLALFVVNAWGDESTPNYLISLGNAINTVDNVKATSGSKIMFYLPNTMDTGNNNHTSFVTCPIQGSGATLSCTSTTPSVGDDISTMLFTLEVADDAASTYYIQAPNGEYLTSALTSQSNTAITTSATQKATFTVVSLDNNCVGFKRADVTNALYLNIQSKNWTDKTIDYWSGTGGWSQWLVYKPEYTTNEILTSLDNISTDKKYATYTIQPQDLSRGYLYTDTENHRLDACGGTSANSANSSIASNPADPRQRFAFIEKDGNYYLYSVADKRFATWSSSNNAVSPLAETVCSGQNTVTLQTAENTVTLQTADGGNNYVIVMIGTGSNRGWINFSPNYDPDIYMNYRTQDVGNKLLVIQTDTPLTEDEYNEALAKILNPVNVTYQVVDANNTNDVWASTTVPQAPNSAISMPSEFSNDYVTLSEPTGTIGTEDCTITYTGTVSEDCPITFSSDFDNATWYQVHFGTSTSDFWAFNEGDVSTGANLSYRLVDNAIDKVNDNAQWAFAGSPYEVRIWNKGAGAGKELHACQNNRPLMESANTYNNKDLTNNAAEMANAHNKMVWELQKTTSSDGQFAFHVPDGGNSYLNRYGGDKNNRLGIWSDGNAHNDKGSAITIAPVSYPADIFDSISTEAPEVSDNPKWGDLASFTAKDLDAFTSAKTTYSTTPSETNYKAVLETIYYTFGQGANASCFITKYKGSDGFVNIANTSTAGTGNSIGLKDGDESAHIHAQTTNVNDANQLWVVTSPSHGVVNLFNVNAQKYMGANIGGTANTVSLSDTPENWNIEWRDDNTFILKSGSGSNDHLNYENNANYKGNLNKWSGNDTWSYTPVSSINLPVHPVGNLSYATICYPFEVKLSEGEAYTATFNAENSSLSLTSIGKTVPAGTPVVVVTENTTESSITATINGTETKAIQTEGNSLSGTYLPLAIRAESNNLTLGTDGTAAGFYKWAGTLKNKAYFTYSTDASSKGFAFSFGDDDPTGISEDLVKAAVLNLQKPIYNVQGQRVGADFKGIIIQDGKKYLQK